MHPIPVPVAIGLNPPASEDNPTQVECIGHVWTLLKEKRVLHVRYSSNINRKPAKKKAILSKLSCRPRISYRTFNLKKTKQAKTVLFAYARFTRELKI